MKNLRSVVTLVVLLLATSQLAFAPPADLFRINGVKVTFLRVHELGSGFGPSHDFIEVEVVFKVDRERDMAFGFKLRDNAAGPANQAMLDVLRDAFNYNHTINVVYEAQRGKKHGTLLRIELVKPNLIGANDRVVREPGVVIRQN